MVNEYTITYINEHYKDNLIDGINKCFNLKLSPTNNISIIDNTIYIVYPNSKVIINMIDNAYYEIERIYNDYKSIYSYELDTEPFKKTTFFNLDEETYLGFEELKGEDGFISRRLFTISKDNNEFYKPDFEREYSYFKTHQVKSTFHYEKNKYIEKINLINDNLIYYSNTNYEYNVLDNPTLNNIETSLSIKRPKDKYYGRIIDNNEILRKTLKYNKPSLIIKNTSYNKTTNKINILEIRVLKNNNILKLYIKNKESKELNKYEITLPYNIDSIVEDDIFVLIKSLPSLIDSPLLKEIITKLEYLRHILRISIGKDFINYDPYDMRLIMFGIDEKEDYPKEIKDNYAYEIESLNIYTNLEFYKKGLYERKLRK